MLRVALLAGGDRAWVERRSGFRITRRRLACCAVAGEFSSCMPSSESITAWSSLYACMYTCVVGDTVNNFSMNNAK